MEVRRVLVVDDDVLIRLLLATVLGEEQWEVCEAGTIAEAEQVLADADPKPRAVVLDESLPDGSGIDLARRARSVVPDAHLVLYSGMSFDQVPPEVDAVVPKSGPPHALADHLATL